MINLNHLFYFYVIASEGGISSAARRLRISQPALSNQMRTFQDRLGHELFVRQGRGVELSRDGRMLLSYARKIFDTVKDMRLALEASNAGMTGPSHSNFEFVRENACARH